MLRKTILKSTRIYLRTLTQNDVTKTYVSWLNDTKINEYLETRFHEQTLDSFRSFVLGTETNPAENLFGIFLIAGDQHIGNIKLGAVNEHHHTGQISLFIGEQSLWGKGYAAEAISMLVNWAFKELGLHKIEAGCYDKNLGSLKAFLNCGFQVEGYFREHFLFGNRRIGSFWLGITSKELLDNGH